MTQKAKERLINDMVQAIKAGKMVIFQLGRGKTAIIKEVNKRLGNNPT